VAGRDRVISQVTRDYVRDDYGSFETTRTAATAVHHQLHGVLDTWPGDPDAGRDTSKEPSTPDDPNQLAGFENSIRDALKRLEVEGRIANVDVLVEAHDTVPGRTLVAIEADDLQSGETLHVEPALLGGGP
jgi:hypothetical protein